MKIKEVKTTEKVYVCDECGKEYKTKEHALMCENKCCCDHEKRRDEIYFYNHIDGSLTLEFEDICQLCDHKILLYKYKAKSVRDLMEKLK